MTNDFWPAFALMLVCEGIMPFAQPAQWRRVMAKISQLGDRELRIMGLLSMLAGALLLYWAKGYGQ